MEPAILPMLYNILTKASFTVLSASTTILIATLTHTIDEQGGGLLVE